jgi:hypothetical protein
MKKIFSLLLLSNVIVFSNNDKPNKPKLHNPLPLEALQFTFDQYSQDFPKDLSTHEAQTFHRFLMQRKKLTKLDQVKSLENEETLLQNLRTNYRLNRKELSSLELAMCAFAHSLNKLRVHQLIAECQAYPREYILTSFEQNYQFKLFPIPQNTFLEIVSLMSTTENMHILITTRKRWIGFLLKHITKK